MKTELTKCKYCGCDADAYTDGHTTWFECHTYKTPREWKQSLSCKVIRKLQKRIKRLEIAGDTLATLTIRNGRSHDQWHEAKGFE